MKKIILILVAVMFSGSLFCQEYLDEDKRYMKLTEVSTSDEYGYNFNNPIKVGDALGAYLNSLKTLDGDIIHIGDYKKQYGLIIVVLIYEKKKEKTTIYFSEEFEQPKAIKGFTYKTINDLPKVILYPADSIVKVNACSEKLYSVNDYLLEQNIGSKDTPSKNPTFNGGLDKLKEYFAKNPLTDKKATQLIFRVDVSFLVNCEGKAGNFALTSKGRGDLATYANQVLGIVNKMPQNWEPAMVDGKPVDCYQVLSFTASGGELTKVSYR